MLAPASAVPFPPRACAQTERVGVVGIPSSSPPRFLLVCAGPVRSLAPADLRGALEAGRAGLGASLALIASATDVHAGAEAGAPSPAVDARTEGGGGGEDGASNA